MVSFALCWVDESAATDGARLVIFEALADGIAGYRHALQLQVARIEYAATHASSSVAADRGVLDEHRPTVEDPSADTHVLAEVLGD